MINFGEFLKTRGSEVTLPERPILIGQKLVENAKIEKLKCDILGDFEHCDRSKKALKSNSLGLI